jgi:hypothetical protein
VSRSAAKRFTRFSRSRGTLSVTFWYSATKTSVSPEIVDGALNGILRARRKNLLMMRNVSSPNHVSRRFAGASGGRLR